MRKKYITFRVSNKQKKRIRELAQEEHKNSMSQYIRDRALKKNTNNELINKLFFGIYGMVKGDIILPKNTTLEKYSEEKKEEKITFLVSEEEKREIKRKAEERELNISEYLRDRSLRSQISNDLMTERLFSFLQNFSEKLESVSPFLLGSRSKKRKKTPTLKIETLDMNESQAKKYEESIRRSSEHYEGELLGELSDVLSLRRRKVDCELNEEEHTPEKEIDILSRHPTLYEEII